MILTKPTLLSSWTTAFLLFTSGLSVPSALARDDTSLKSLNLLKENLEPGAVIQIPDGIYVTRGALTLTGIRGTAQKPVIIQATNRGKAVIAGAAGFVLKDCAHVVIEGFVFENDADQQCVRLENCDHVRVTRNIFHPKERATPRHWEHWVTVEGARSGFNRIDYNLFERKVNRGSPLFIRGDDVALVCSQHDRIDHNHFRDVVYANRENGHETIRTGGNDLGAVGRSSYTIIEDNLLERCSGEDECISLKSSDNIVRRNTLVNCRGAICLRLGNRNVVSGNIIIATAQGPGFGGIKVFGFEHVIADNYFAGLTGEKHEAPFSLFPGLHATSITENIGERYDDHTASAATRCIITGNIWVDCAPLQIGLEKEDKSWKHLPTACTFARNLIIRTKPHPKPIVNLGMVRDLQASHNTAAASPVPDVDSWAEWFSWVDTMPEFHAPKPLNSRDVGPHAP